jgi:hypothetical protein
MRTGGAGIEVRTDADGEPGCQFCRADPLDSIAAAFGCGDDRRLTQAAKKMIHSCATYSRKVGSRSGPVRPLVEHRSLSMEIGCQSFPFYHRHSHQHAELVFCKIPCYVLFV